MSILLTLAPLLAIIYLANLIDARQNELARKTLNAMLAITNLAVLAVGLALRFGPQPTLQGLLDETLPGFEMGPVGLALAVIGVWGGLMCLSPVRRAISRVLPAINPDSSAHTLALVALGYLGGNALLSSGAGGVEALAAADVSPTIVDILAQQLVFVLAAFLGVGLLTRRDGRALDERLGLARPTLSQLLVGVRWMVVFVFLQATIGALWMALQPEQAQQLSGLNADILGNFDTVWEWFLLAAAAGLGEELLFRGALQPIFGLVPTSLVFAVSHTQYGLSPATLTVFLLSLVLGIIRRRTNTTTAIFTHAGYNFILGLLSLLVTRLAPLVNGVGG